MHQVVSNIIIVDRLPVPSQRDGFRQVVLRNAVADVPLR
jgi:hypothetical protein